MPPPPTLPPTLPSPSAHSSLSLSLSRQPQPQLQPQLQLQLQPQSTLQHFPQPSTRPFQQQGNFPVMIGQREHVHGSSRPDEEMAAVLATMPHSGHQNIYPPRTSSLSHASFQVTPGMQAPRDYTNHTLSSDPTPSHNRHARPARPNEDGTLFRDMYFGTPSSNLQRPAEQQLRFGSDALFARSRGYVPPEHESSEALEEKRKTITRGALIPNTRPSSPIGNMEASTPIVHEHINGNVKEEEITDSSLMGRTKGKAKMEEEEDDENTAQTSCKPVRKRKGKDPSEPASAPPGKRRKSAPSQANKPPRENLTDAQKRENHIQSEKKRRSAIKEGYENLAFIVPALKRTGYSKSAMLYVAADWLETLVKENEEISARLSKK